MPLSSQKVYDVNRQLKMKSCCASIASTSVNLTPSRGKGRDLLFVIMEQCKLTDKVNRFVQEVTCAPEPMTVLATAQQLFDLGRFCCNSSEYCIMGVDPTFNLGDFSVTPTVYQHLLVEDKISGKSPWMAGPMLIHYHKQFRNYNFFFSTLVGLHRPLSDIQAAGTDGEKNIIEALSHQFKNVILLRCFRHLRVNIERHLTTAGTPKAAIGHYIREIFGWVDSDGVRKEGLVDSKDISEFENNLSTIKSIWDERDKQIGVSSIGFYDWFMQYKFFDFCSGTLQSTRESAGLGCPLCAYYTNPNEAINSVLKRKTNYKKQQLPVFITTMKDFVLEQQSEVETAIIGGGKYKLKLVYRFLEVNNGTWWRMNEEQRKANIKKFNSQPLKPPQDLQVACSSSSEIEKSDDQCHLSVTEEVARTKLNLSPDVVNGIWQKARSLVLDQASTISYIPGGNKKDRYVLSKSGTQPHAVTFNESYMYKCDDKCLHFKSLSVCSHSIASAEVNGDLVEFLNLYLRVRSTKGINLFQASKHGMPAGAGCKGGKPKVKKRKSETALETIPFSLTMVNPDRASSAKSSAGILSHSTTNHESSSWYSPSANFSSIYNSKGVNYPEHLSWYSNYPSPFNSTFVQGQPNAVFPSPPTNFNLVVLHGNISTCYGCRKKFPIKDSGGFADPPYNLAIQHEEDRNFFNPQTSVQQSKRSNAYYHVFLPCVAAIWPNFIGDDLKVSEETKCKLTREHIDLVFQNFGVDPKLLPNT